MKGRNVTVYFLQQGGFVVINSRERELDPYSLERTGYRVLIRDKKLKLEPAKLEENRKERNSMESMPIHDDKLLTTPVTYKNKITLPSKKYEHILEERRRRLRIFWDQYNTIGNVYAAKINVVKRKSRRVALIRRKEKEIEALPTCPLEEMLLNHYN